jgi:hypothetical protein
MVRASDEGNASVWLHGDGGRRHGCFAEQLLVLFGLAVAGGRERGK